VFENKKANTAFSFRMDYYLIYKPYGVHSQFKPGEGQAGLGTLHDFPKDVYPVGRLDADSEGLLLLTNDSRVNQLLLNPKHAHPRTYYVQVEGMITDEAIQQLNKGVTISIDGKKHHTKPAHCEHITPPPLPERHPPIRFRKTIPDSWISLTITEGKNRQVRKMTAAVGFPTLRLVRVKIGKLEMQDMESGKVQRIDRDELYAALIRPFKSNT
jgi:23S rRNA pseudouridine2457 synthase